MIGQRTLIAGMLMSALIPSPLLAAVRFDQSKSGFDITRPDGSIVPVFVDSGDLPGVRRDAADLCLDIRRVTGTAAVTRNDRGKLPEHVNLVASLGLPPVIDLNQLAAAAATITGLVGASPTSGRCRTIKSTPLTKNLQMPGAPRSTRRL